MSLDTLRSSVRDHVHHLLFAPRSAWPMAIARIVIGIGILGWAVSMMFEVSTFMSDDGLVGPDFASSDFRWITLDSAGSVQIALIVLTLASIPIIIGFRPTIFLVVAFILLVAVQRRTPIILNSGDIILRNLTLLLAFTPTSAALSFDRWRRLGRDGLRTAPLVAPWGLRFVQLQMMLVYFFAFWGKTGDQWREGTAVSTAFRLTDLHRFGPPGILTDNLLVSGLLTWGTLVVELALAVLLWYKPARPVLIVAGLVLHFTIDTFVLVGFFGIAMAAGLMTFLDGDSVQRFVDRRRARTRPTAATTT
jgi:HTTM domain